MHAIKFSHYYKKFPPVITDPTYITRVARCHYRDLSKIFIVQDTETIEGEFYPLPVTDLIIIYLYTEGHKWQTIRRYTPAKYDYYRSLVGQEVKIIVELNKVEQPKLL